MLKKIQTVGASLVCVTLLGLAGCDRNQNQRTTDTAGMPPRTQPNASPAPVTPDTTNPSQRSRSGSSGTMDTSRRSGNHMGSSNEGDSSRTDRSGSNRNM